MFATKKSIQTLLKESQAILSISYVISIGIGMLFSYYKYAAFGINFFDYASVFDFLLAPFSDFYILLFTVIALSVTYFIIVLDDFYLHKFPEEYKKIIFGLDKKKWFSYLRKSVTVLLFLFYLVFSAHQYGKMSKKKIEQSAAIQVEFMDQQVRTGKMIGKTKEVLFLLHNEQAEIILLTSSVRQIVLTEK